jgi:hypothetical protein
MMDRHGSDTLYSCDLALNDIMRERTELLIFMAKDFLGGKSLGISQRQVIERNALLVELDCVKSIKAVGGEPINDHVCVCIRFYYYLKSLAEIMISTAQGVEVDATCKHVIHEHIDVISEMLEENDQINDHYIEDDLSLLLLKLVAVI